MSGSNSRKATEVFSFRMTPDEAAQLRAVASSQGLGPTTFARRAAASAAALPIPAYEARTPDPKKADLAKVLGQIGRMASNLNQLTKLANTMKAMPEPRELKLLFGEIRELRKNLLEL